MVTTYTFQPLVGVTSNKIHLATLFIITMMDLVV